MQKPLSWYTQRAIRNGECTKVADDVERGIALLPLAEPLPNILKPGNDVWITIAWLGPCLGQDRSHASLNVARTETREVDGAEIAFFETSGKGFETDIIVWERSRVGKHADFAFVEAESGRRLGMVHKAHGEDTSVRAKQYR